jgi:amino acid transporter
MSTKIPVTPQVDVPRLRRSLTLWNLIIYGIIVIQPVAPMSVFGVLSQRGHGHVVTTILIAMVAMLFTAISYGRMARAYPSAGSAFTYVGQEINPALGYVTGWSMVMDYLLNPMICIIWISQQAHVFVPQVKYWEWAIVVGVVFTALNLQGVKTSSRVNSLLAAGMGVVIVMFLVAAARYIFGLNAGGDYFTRPFYDPTMWNTNAVLSGTSIAVLTYIGFDGISTLSEEAENPRRNILLATVLTCVFIGILAAIEVYAAQLLWPASQAFPDVDTAFTFVAQRAWAPLFGVVGMTLIVANFGSGMGAHLGAARLLYGMGRSNALPKKFFGAVDPKRRIPRNNVIFIGVLALAGAFLLPAIAGKATGYELGATLLNFGALIAFMGVNLSALVHYYIRGEQKKLSNLLPPLLGFLVCALLWWKLSTKALILGAIWLAIGVAYGAIKTRGFRGDLVNFEVPPEDEVAV